MTNPFAPNVPSAPAEAPQQAPNPFGQQQPQYAPPAGNPYATPAAPQQGNPYGGQPQQYAAPAPAQQQYAPQQQVQQYAAPAAPVHQGPPPALGQLNTAPPPVVGEGKGARLADMFGRLVLVFPLSIARVPRNPQYITNEQRAQGNIEQDRLTATVVVLDDGQGGMNPIWYGGNPAAFPVVPPTDSAPLPYVRKGMWINQSRLISQLRDFLPAGAGQPGGMIAGRVHKAGPNNNDPWYLIAATDAEMHRAQQYLDAVAAGHLPHPLA